MSPLFPENRNAPFFLRVEIMATIIGFPSASERDWHDLEVMFRSLYSDVPDGIETLEQCLPAIKAAWQQIFVAFEARPSFTIPGPLSVEQVNAIRGAINEAVKIVSDRLKWERSQALALLANKLFLAEYGRRNGSVS